MVFADFEIDSVLLHVAEDILSAVSDNPVEGSDRDFGNMIVVVVRDFAVFVLFSVDELQKILEIRVVTLAALVLELLQLVVG